MTEGDLLARLRAGDEDAFMDIVMRYTPLMRRIALGYVRSPAVADEVVQEAWLGVLRGLGRFEGRSSLKTWVLRIVANIAIRRREREARSVPVSFLEPGDNMVQGEFGFAAFAIGAYAMQAEVRRAKEPNFTIDVGRIQWSDLTADADLQYVIPQGRTVTAYLGVGLSVHLMDGSGAAINGTFVEDALDGVSAGLNGTLGFEIATSPTWRFTVEARGVLATQLSTGSLRLGLMYRLPGKR